MRTSDKGQNNVASAERFSRRIQNGVEIVEREIISTIRVVGDRYETVAAPTSLVVTDAKSAAKLFIAKTRAEFADLDAYLRGITGRSLKTAE